MGNQDLTAEIGNVKHLIRNPKSKQYFNHGQWTADVQEAQDFRTIETARAVAIQCGLNNVELIQQAGAESSDAADFYSAPLHEPLAT